MTTLVDLPDEVLVLIFREFLSKSLPDHSYLCNWLLEPDARRTRANLYSLSRVSKALSKIALPLLYEQLFDNTDIQTFLMSSPRPQLVAKCMSSVRYLTISSEEDVLEHHSQTYSTALQLTLMHCVQIQHMDFTYTGGSPRFSAILLGLAELPAFKRLRSLRLRLNTRDAEHTVFRDVSHLTALEGLLFTVNYGTGSSGHPELPLAHLKELEVDYLATANDTSACMALASPDNLRCLRLWQIDSSTPNPTPMPQSFGKQIWKTLQYMYLDSHSPLIGDIFSTRSAVQFPALRQFRIYLDSGAQPRELFRTLPPNLNLLHIRGIDMGQALDILTLITDDRWASGALEMIEMGFDELPDDFQWASQTFTRDMILQTAANAMRAARSRNVVLDPSDLVGAIEDWIESKDLSDSEDVSDSESDSE